MQPKKRVKHEHPVDTSYSHEDYVKLQLDELYAGSTRPVTSYPDVEVIKKCLISLKPSVKLNLSEAVESAKEKRSKWPLFETFEVPNGSFQFTAPTTFTASGSYGTTTLIKSQKSVDLAMHLPAEFLEDKDYLNCRYIVKRALYLLHIIPKLQKLEAVKAIKFSCLDSDPLKPVLNIKLNNEKLSVNLVPVISSNVFKTSLLTTDRNCLRPGKIFTENIECCDLDHTKFYNNSVLGDIVGVDSVRACELIRGHAVFQKAAVLINAWCDMQGLAQDITSSIVNMLMLYLHNRDTITRDMDVFTILKQFWLFASRDLQKSIDEGISMTSSSTPGQANGIFTDTGYNILYTTNPAVLQEFVKLSQIMIDVLDSKDYNKFIQFYSHKDLSMFKRYDMLFSVKIPDTVSTRLTLQYAGVTYKGCVDRTKEVLMRALGDRINTLNISIPTTHSWSRTASPTSPSHMLIGLNVNKETWMAQVERGPPAELPAAEEFKQFWGEKSVMRRFQDGSIIQAVVWQGSTVQEKRTIVNQIIKYILSVHLNIEDVREHQIVSKDVVGRGYYEGDGEEQAGEIITAFNELSKILRNCDKIPLNITSVQGVASVLRNTDLFPQSAFAVTRSKRTAAPEVSQSCPAVVISHEIVCHFALTGKWPEDVRGILRLKTAFYLALKEELQSLNITARVNPDFIDIARNGYIFRLRFFVPKEAKLRYNNISFWTPCTSDELRLQTEIMPHVASLLSSFALQYSAYPLTVRFFKRWVSRHMLSNYISDIFCELVVASIFCDNKSLAIPQTATAGFLRVISFLAMFDWDVFPLFLNFNESLSAETFEMYNNFLLNRKSYPDACIVCPRNDLSQITASGPSKPILNILTVLASQSLEQCEKEITKQEDTFSKMFIPDRTSFDIVIHLKASQTGQRQEKQYAHHAKAGHFPVVDYSPPELFITQLTAAYGNICFFFYDQHKADIIGKISINTSFDCYHSFK